MVKPRNSFVSLNLRQFNSETSLNGKNIQTNKITIAVVHCFGTKHTKELNNQVIACYKSGTASLAPVGFL